MLDEFIQSEESFMGYVLKVRRYKLTDRMIYHRCCDIYKDNNRVGISKTKKEAKDIIAHGCML